MSRSHIRRILFNIALLTPLSLNAEVIFETDFSQDTGFRAQSVGVWRRHELPTGWHGIRAEGNSLIEVVENKGINGKNALRLKWDPNISQPNINLAVHLTGDQSTGYDELYIRYQIKLPNNFKAGDDGKYLHYWKWGRLWQNTDPKGSNWTENRADSGYVVWNFGGDRPYTDTNIVWSANDGDNLHKGSAGGEQISVDWFVSGSEPSSTDGYFEGIGNGAWALNWTDRPGTLENNTSQRYHTIEWRFKLASSPTAQDGIAEIWVDGAKQRKWARIAGQLGAPNFSGIPTVRNGSGFNFFSFFDNLAGWNYDWNEQGVDGSVYVNDVVVSTTPIGSDYVVGKGYPPRSPTLNKLQ